MDKFTNMKKGQVCDISKIYSDNITQDNSATSNNKHVINLSFIKNNEETRDTNKANYTSVKVPKFISGFNKETQNEEPKIKCLKCSNYINKGEIVYHCECDETFIHSICYLKNLTEPNIQNCPKCNLNLKIGIYELTQPSNTLNTGLRYKTKNKLSGMRHKTNNTSKKSSFSLVEMAGSINSNMISTNEGDDSDEKSGICMDTNINDLEDYDKLCDNATDIPLESMIEILNEKEKNISKVEEKNNNINTNYKELNIRSTLINGKNKNNEVNKTIINRVALSPLTITNTPYTCNKRKGLRDLTSIPNNTNNMKNKTGLHYIYNNSNNNISNINKINRKLYFQSDEKNKDIINEINNNLNNSINSLLNMTNSNYLNNSLRNLDFSDVTNEEINEEENDDDKENNPPLLKENSRFTQNDENNNNNENNNNTISNNENNIEINISGGISHIVSNTKRAVEIPITIEINTINTPNINYSKETLLIFNTNSLNLEQVLLILRIFNEKMGKDDKIYSNIFKSVEGLGKSKIEEILNINNNNYYSVFKETEKINYEKISTLIEYAIDLSMNSLSNIFNVLLINDIDEISSINCDYSNEIKKIIKKLENTKVNLLKYFSINTILLDDQGTKTSPKNKNEKNMNFISYLFDLSMMCMGYFYSPKNLEELTKSVYLYCSNLEQYSLLNAKLIIKGNQDPSIYLEGLNYPLNKINHNDFEIIIGPLLKKEKKIINLVATIILNNPNINIHLPLFDVSCEYLSKKNETTIENNLTVVNENIFKERTEFFRLNIPIIRQKKKIKISYSVMLRNLISKIAQRVSKSIDSFKKNDFENALIYIYEAKDLFEKFFKNQKDFINKIKMNINDNENNPGFHNSLHINKDINKINFSLLDNSSFEINISNNNINNSNMLEDKKNDLMKINNFICAINNDLNLCINIIKSKNISQICQLLSIQQSLSFYRVVNFDDNRFLEDNYLNMK